MRTPSSLPACRCCVWFAVGVAIVELCAAQNKVEEVVDSVLPGSATVGADDSSASPLSTESESQQSEGSTGATADGAESAAASEPEGSSAESDGAGTPLPPSPADAPAPPTPPTPPTQPTPKPSPSTNASSHVPVSTILEVVEVAKEVDVPPSKLSPAQAKARALASDDVRTALAGELNVKHTQKLIKVAEAAGVPQYEVNSFETTLRDLVSSQLNAAQNAAPASFSGDVSADALIALGAAISNAKRVRLSSTAAEDLLAKHGQNAYSRNDAQYVANVVGALGLAQCPASAELAAWSSAYRRLRENSNGALEARLRAVERAKEVGLPHAAVVDSEQQVQSQARAELERVLEANSTPAVLMEVIEIAKRANVSFGSLSSADAQLRAQALANLQDALSLNATAKAINKALADAPKAGVPDYEVASYRAQVHSSMVSELTTAQRALVISTADPAALGALADLVRKAQELGVNRTEVEAAKEALRQHADVVVDSGNADAMLDAVQAMEGVGITVRPEVRQRRLALTNLRSTASSSLPAQLAALKSAKKVGLPFSMTMDAEDRVRNLAEGQLTKRLNVASTNIEPALAAMETAIEAEVPNATVYLAQSQLRSLAKAQLEDLVTSDKHFKIINKGFERARRAGVSEVELSESRTKLLGHCSSKLSSARIAANSSQAEAAALETLGTAILNGKMFELETTELDPAQQALEQHAETGFAQQDVARVESAVRAMAIARMQVRPELQAWAQAAKEARVKGQGTAADALQAFKDAQKSGLPASEIAAIRATAQQKAIDELDKVVSGA